MVAKQREQSINQKDKTMKYRTSDVAEKLDVTGSTVNNLVHRGYLTDLKAHMNGTHEFEFDSRQVNAFARVYRKNKRKQQFIPLEGRKAEVVTEAKSHELGGFFSRLKRIEDKVDALNSSDITSEVRELKEKVETLIKMWS